MGVPQPPATLTPAQLNQYYRLAAAYTAAIAQNNGMLAQQIMQQMQVLCRPVVQNPGMLQYIRAAIEPALAFFGAGWAYIRLVVTSLGRLLVSAAAAIFTWEVWAFLGICLALVLFYKWAMDREAAARARARAAAQHPSAGMLAHLHAAHKAAFGMGDGRVEA